MNEQQMIEQLSQYRQKKARIQVLSSYSVGAGITVSRLNGDDQLQELHRRLRGLPSYMYLSGYEQKLENAAHAYMTRYPAGVKSQKQAVPVQAMDPEDEQLLRELRNKIQKVIEARGYDVRDDVDEVLERLAELQDLQAEVEQVETVLEAMDTYEPDFANILRLQYLEGKSAGEVQTEMNLSRRTYWRKISAAEMEYKRLAR
ncbi:RNA polymerase, sigma-24 subunit, ECF subfamily [Paenibacillus algicola]|uniref:RNA polymerase, sigma-24 subunit, ECF subfamily n=1 Tax=Paenibacillus algicola TaxID=2565926 RepID=A0A4P8XKR7_9BACL|nr:RNA polymerase subunit sigma-24 [Paenibacillus algicola]QCT03306.1 RNA polymerase, sigma-24 subunit, ECF subfamily [Paenibacillus algicola]